MSYLRTTLPLINNQSKVIIEKLRSFTNLKIVLYMKTLKLN